MPGNQSRGHEPPASTSVVSYGSSRCRLGSVQIVRRGLARPSIGDNVECDLLSLVEDTHASAFDCADVHEDILTAIIRLNEAEAFLVIEPLHGSFCHLALLFRYVCNVAARQRSRFVRDFEKSRQSRRGMRGEAKSFGRSSIDVIWPFSAGLQGYPARVLRKGWLFGQPAPMLVLRIAIWGHHHQQCEATRGAAYLSTDIRPGDAGRAALCVQVTPKCV